MSVQIQKSEAWDPSFNQIWGVFLKKNKMLQEPCNSLNHVPAWFCSFLHGEQCWVWICLLKIRLRSLQTDFWLKSWSAALNLFRCFTLQLAVNNSFSPAIHYSCRHAKKALISRESEKEIKVHPRTKAKVKAILHRACSQVVSVPLVWMLQHRGFYHGGKKKRCNTCCRW